MLCFCLEYFDMMMMQNAQMHQLFMQQLLAQGLRPKEDQQTVVIEQQPQQPAPNHPQFITVSIHFSLGLLITYTEVV